MRVLSNADVAALLPMEQAIEVVDRVMRHVSDGGAQMPLRHVVPVGEANGMGVMSGAIGAPDCYGVKLVSLFPERAARSEAVDVFQRVRGGVEGYLWVQTVTGAMICAAAWLLMRAVGLQNAEFWTFVIFIVGFIPVLGGAIAGLAPPIFALVQFESYWPAVILLGGLQLILFISGNLIQPRMQGDNQNIDPVVVLLALAFWGQIWGVVGMFLSTPLAVMAMAVLSEFKGSRWMAVLLSGDGEPYAEKDPPAPKRGRVNPPQAGGV